MSIECRLVLAMVVYSSAYFRNGRDGMGLLGLGGRKRKGGWS